MEKDEYHLIRGGISWYPHPSLKKYPLTCSHGSPLSPSFLNLELWFPSAAIVSPSTQFSPCHDKQPAKGLREPVTEDARAEDLYQLPWALLAVGAHLVQLFKPYPCIPGELSTDICQETTGEYQVLRTAWQACLLFLWHPESPAKILRHWESIQFGLFSVRLFPRPKWTKITVPGSVRLHCIQLNKHLLSCRKELCQPLKKKQRCIRCSPGTRGWESVIVEPTDISTNI